MVPKSSPSPSTPKRRIFKKTPVVLPLVKVDTKSNKITVLTKNGGRVSAPIGGFPWAQTCELGGVTFTKRRLLPSPVIEFRKGLNIVVDGSPFEGYQVPIAG